MNAFTIALISGQIKTKYIARWENNVFRLIIALIDDVSHVKMKCDENIGIFTNSKSDLAQDENAMSCSHPRS